MIITGENIASRIIGSHKSTPPQQGVDTAEMRGGGERKNNNVKESWIQLQKKNEMKCVLCINNNSCVSISEDEEKFRSIVTVTENYQHKEIIAW